MTTLTLHAISITVPDQRVTYNNIRKKYQRLAEAAEDSFAANFTATFKNMDDIDNKCTEQFIPMLRETATPGNKSPPTSHIRQRPPKRRPDPRI